jgi:5-formyltetrahydrofolate cyclo-ligase
MGGQGIDPVLSHRQPAAAMLGWEHSSRHGGSALRLSPPTGGPPTDPSDDDAWPPHPTLPKADLRRLCRRRRRQHLSAAAAIRTTAERELPALLPPGTRLGLYWPLPGEPDLRCLMDHEHLSQRLALPAIVPPRRMVYLPWDRGMGLEPDLCGIPAPPLVETAADLTGAAPEPLGLPPEALGLLLVPALALDAAGLRLGSGGGFYDRLRADPAWKAIPTLAVLPSACLVPALPADRWDVPFDGWLDERGLHWG